jgi:transcriptional regulator with XRE-family HTH domain
MLEGMTLQELLRAYGITRPIELAEALGIDRRVASRLWRGHQKFGTKTAMRLFEAKGIPIDVLLRAQAEPPAQTPRGRRRKRPPPPAPEEDQPE